MDSIMVGYVYTHHKEYCRFLYPKTFNSLTYKNKSAALIDETGHPELLKLATGEQRAAAGRQLLIEEARRLNPDWLFMLDIDIEPDPDCLEKLLAVKHSIVGGINAVRGAAWKIDGHNYTDKKSLKKAWLKPVDVDKDQEVDVISGGTLLIARGVYSKVDYGGYLGSDTIPCRDTTNNEYLLIKAQEKMHLRPHACFDCRSWHYHEDGRAYKLFGEQKIWKTA